ncbi:MAG: tyrosine-type recombinase/integrase [Thermoguttaceae bacterium]
MPLYELTAVRRGKHKGEKLANIRESVKEGAASLGLERKLLYATLIYTGLRKSELASITLGQVFLDGDIPHLVLKAKDEKNRRGANLPIHPELVPHLRKWIEYRQSGGMTPKDKLFTVPTGLDKILNRDLAYAKIAKRDTLDRVIDVHALRHTHATLMSQEGVAPKVTQSSMRHSDIRLTMNVYSHTELSDVAKGVSRLPNFLSDKDESEK